VERVRVGIGGCGFVAHIHVNALSRVAGIEVEIAGIASRTKERVESFAKQCGINNCYTDYRYLLDSKDIDVIDVCVPNILHEKVCIETAMAGKHIICEKPLTGYFGKDLAETVENVGKTIPKRQMYVRAMESAQKIVQEAKSNEVKLCYAENYVYAPELTKAKRLIGASKGTILDIRAEESHSGSHAAYAKKWKLAGGGSLLRLGSHPLGAAIHLKHFEGLMTEGKPIKVKSVTAEIGNLTKTPSFLKESKKWLVSDWEDVEDWSAVFLTFEDGTKATVFANDVTLGGVVNTVTVQLSNSVVKCNLSGGGACQAYAPAPEIFSEEYLTEKLETRAGWSFPAPDEDWMRGYPQEMQDFMESVCSDRDPISDGELGKEVVRVAYAGYIAAEEGRKVEISELRNL